MRKILVLLMLALGSSASAAELYFGVRTDALFADGLPLPLPGVGVHQGLDFGGRDRGLGLRLATSVAFLAVELRLDAYYRFPLGDALGPGTSLYAGVGGGVAVLPFVAGRFTPEAYGLVGLEAPLGANTVFVEAAPGAVFVPTGPVFAARLSFGLNLRP